MPWEHGKAGASPVTATNFSRGLLSLSPGAIGLRREAADRNPEGNSKDGAKRSQSCHRDHFLTTDRKPRSLDLGLITLVTRSITGACHQF